jgi:hypothetical protein
MSHWADVLMAAKYLHSETAQEVEARIGAGADVH